ncbi:MAG TPA: pyridoxal-phosphate dependent enzyme, partial [Chthoniobacterales bacterium]
RLAGEIPGAWWANQFDNVANRLAHYHTTGPEIWRQTEGKITGFSASVGTGGTLAGTALALKERKDSIRVICPDPYGAAMWSWFKLGHTQVNDGDSFAEGIGQGRVTKNLENIPVDDAIRVPDALALRLLYHLLRHEGLFLSLSSAINVAGALRLALQQGPGQTIVTILCDSGSRYLSKLYSPVWLNSHGFQHLLAPESVSADALVQSISQLPE